MSRPDIEEIRGLLRASREIVGPGAALARKAIVLTTPALLDCIATLETDLATARKERDEARAIVDAAKAWAEWRVAYGGVLVHETEDALFNAVAALTPPPAEGTFLGAPITNDPDEYAERACEYCDVPSARHCAGCPDEPAEDAGE